MPMLVKIQRKGQMTLPSRLRAAIGVNEGDRLEASVQHGKIVLTPTYIVDRSKFPTADDEYTPEQRRIMDARLAESDQDIKAGKVYGPFATHKEFIAALHKETKSCVVRRKLTARQNETVLSPTLYTKLQQGAEGYSKSVR